MNLSRRGFFATTAAGAAAAGAGAADGRQTASVPAFELDELTLVQLQKYTAQSLVEKYLARIHRIQAIDRAGPTLRAVGRDVVHGERRAREMEEVAETVREAGVEPIMAEATARRMDWSARLNLREAFGGKAPADYREFARIVAETVSANRTCSGRSSGA